MALMIMIVTTAVIALAVFMLPQLMRLVSPFKRWELRSTTASLQEIELAARSYATQYPDACKRLLRSRYPQERYAAALSAHAALEFHELVGALRIEPAAVIRRAIAKRIGQAGTERFASAPLPGLEDLFGSSVSIPEIGYIVEAFARRGAMSSTLLDPLPGPMHTLAALAGARIDNRGSGSPAFDLASSIQSDQPHNPLQHALAMAFKEGPDRYAWPEGITLGRQQVDEGLAELSPFDAGGLGTLDELQNIKKIDQMYLFFRHLAFLLERDLLRTSGTGARSSSGLE
jgi:hypothetical protein